MPNDVITLNAIRKELLLELKNGKINKVYQPEIDEITLSINNFKETKNLVLSANPINPRAHITKQKKENPLIAANFCMVLRKYLVGGTVEDIKLENSDRILRFTISAKNELQDNIKYFLIVELMGRYSNIILLKEDLTIIDAIKRIGFEQSTTRYILPNLKYIHQYQNKITLDEKDKLKEFFLNNKTIDENLIMENISGLSKETTKEILYRYPQNIVEGIAMFFDINNTTLYQPCISFYDNGKIKDFFVTKYLSLKGNFQNCKNLNECLDEYYYLHDNELRKKAHTKKITTFLKRLQKKTEKRIQENKDKLKEQNNIELYKQKGELILTNLYKIKKGDTLLCCENFYTNEKIDIELDPLLYPQQNSEKYFKKYRKTKKAIEISNEQIKKLELQKEYLKTIEISINNSTSRQEYDEILNELNTLGNMKKTIKQYKETKKKNSKPLHFQIENIDIFLGKNNLQNVDVTFNIGESKDIWLHAKNYHGSHCIIKSQNPPINVLVKAAEICAFYSDAKSSDKVEIDYTQRKNVKKISNGMIGMVTYSNYKTILVKPKAFL